MGNQGHSSRQNEPKRARMAPVRAPARKSNGYDDTNQAPRPTQQPRSTQQPRLQQPKQSRLPQEQIETAPSPASNSQQPEDFEYGSQQDDGTVMEDIENASEASIGSGDPDVGLAAAVSALSSYVQMFSGQLQTNNTILQKLLDQMKINNQRNGELRIATQFNTKTVMMMFEFMKLNTLPHVNPVPGCDGTGPATFNHRNLPPGPPDQGGTGQYASNGFIQ